MQIKVQTVDKNHRIRHLNFRLLTEGSKVTFQENGHNREDGPGVVAHHARADTSAAQTVYPLRRMGDQFPV